MRLLLGLFCNQVRFDDTNPTKEKDEYTQNIIKDMQVLGLKYEKITYTSDYFPQVSCYSMAVKAHPLFTSRLCFADDADVL